MPGARDGGPSVHEASACLGEFTWAGALCDRAGAEPADAEHSPLPVFEVVGDQAPPAGPDDQVVRLDAADGQKTVLSGGGA